MGRIHDRREQPDTVREMANGAPAPGRRTLTEQLPDAAPPGGAPEAFPVPRLTVPPHLQGTPMHVRESIRLRVEQLVEARTRLQRIEQASRGPGVEAMRGELGALARGLSAYLVEIAPTIRQLDSEPVNQMAIQAAEEIRRTPPAYNDRTIAQNLSTAAGILEVTSDVLGQASGSRPLTTLAMVAGVFGGVAGVIHGTGRMLGPDGNFGDAVAVGGSILGAIAAMRGATPLGIAAFVIEQIGAGVSDGIRDQRDRDALRDAMLRAGVPAEIARTIANAEPEIVREMSMHNVPSATVVEIARVAPNILTNGNPALTPRIIEHVARWPPGQLSPRQLDQLRMWNNVLAR